MSSFGKFYDHGVDMASEIPASEKSDGFNQFWYKNGQGLGISKKEARRAYNRGWKDYHSGGFDKSRAKAGRFWFFVALAIGGAWYLMRDTKPPETTPTAALPPTAQSGWGYWPPRGRYT